MKAAKGFTLIELAIVIAIIAILAAVAIPRFANMQHSANRAAAQAYLSNLNTAAATWMAQNAQVPTNFNQFVSNAVGAVPANQQQFTIAIPKLSNSANGACPAPPGGNTWTCTGWAAGAGNAGVGNVTFTLTNGQVTATNTGALVL